jgi:hypothetical protein
MSRYGTVIEDITETSINTPIYNDICRYFDNPSMTKTSESQGMSIYASKVRTGLMLDNKYVMAIVSNDSSKIGTVKDLSELHWVSLQTRTIRDKLECGSFAYKQKKDFPFMETIELRYRDDKSTVYNTKVYKNLSIALLHHEKMQFEYPTSGNLSAALETYKTVLSL